MLRYCPRDKMPFIKRNTKKALVQKKRKYLLCLKVLKFNNKVFV